MDFYSLFICNIEFRFGNVLAVYGLWWSLSYDVLLTRSPCSVNCGLLCHKTTFQFPGFSVIILNHQRPIGFAGHRRRSEALKGSSAWTHTVWGTPEVDHIYAVMPVDLELIYLHTSEAFRKDQSLLNPLFDTVTQAPGCLA